MKTVLVTGIDKGIGAMLCQKFLKEGWKVLGTVYTHIPPHHEHLIAFHLDLSESLSIKTCAKSIIETGLKIDVLINDEQIPW